MTMMSKTINVGSAIILRDTPEGVRVLIAQRKPDAKLEPGKWEFPGGKLEPMEHPQECLIREIREELDLEITVGESFDIASHIYEVASGTVHVLLLFYLCRAKSADFKKIDVADARWISVDELPNFEYAAADIATVEKLRRYLMNSTNLR